MSEEKKPKTKKETPAPLSTTTARAKVGTRAAKRPVTPGQEQTPPAEPVKRALRARKPAAPAARARKQPDRRKVVTAPQTAERSEAVPTRAPSQGLRLSIVMITPEAHPFAKTGGLAEVVGALPDAFARLGHSVTVILPKYRGVSLQNARPLELSVPMGATAQPVTVHEGTLHDNVTVALVDPDGLFDRDGFYGTPGGDDYPDNAWRFAVFSRAALEYVRARGTRPSVIHAHDWQTGLVPVYQKMQLSNDPVVGGVPVVFTIHNLAFQGLFPSSNLPQVGLGWEMLNIQAMEYWGRISYLKGGINFSEKITTVSPKYAREIVQPELGFGFDGVLARRAADLVGILNGIDTERWNPERDEFVPAKFNADDLSAKDSARRALLEAVSLPIDSNIEGRRRPVIGLVSRLTDQKGFDLIAAAAEPLMALDATWVMLGSGDARYEELWRSLAARYPDRVSATIGFDERLAHLIEAGSDIFLMPSRFEPCGLNQMYSLRYGTVPVVRATGGLDDTVQDVDQGGAGTGFKFRDYAPGALVGAVERALAVFQDPTAWTRIQQTGMRQDVSWDASAREYVKVYRALLGG